MMRVSHGLLLRWAEELQELINKNKKSSEVEE